MNLKSFDFSAAQAVAFEKFRQMHPDVVLQKWVSDNATASGENVENGVWRIDFLVFEAASLRADESIERISDHEFIVKKNPDTGVSSVVVGRPSDGPSELIFRILLDGRDGSMKVEFDAEFDGFDFDKYKSR